MKRSKNSSPKSGVKDLLEALSAESDLTDRASVPTAGSRVGGTWLPESFDGRLPDMRDCLGSEHAPKLLAVLLAMAAELEDAFWTVWLELGRDHRMGDELKRGPEDDVSLAARTFLQQGDPQALRSLDRLTVLIQSFCHCVRTGIDQHAINHSSLIHPDRIKSSVAKEGFKLRLLTGRNGGYWRKYVELADRAGPEFVVRHAEGEIVHAMNELARILASEETPISREENGTR